MTPSELLSHLQQDDPRRQEAARALVALLSQLVRGRLVEPSSRQSFEIRRDVEREEVVSRVALKVIQCSPLPVAGKSDGECRRYLSTMLVRAHIAEYRKRSRLVLPGDDKLVGLRGTSTATDESANADAADDYIERARALLDRAFDRVLSERQERFREAVVRAWKQINELVFAQVSFATILLRDEGADAAQDRAAFVRARNRVFKNHERLRVALREASDAMLAEGSLTESDAKALDEALILLFRCQNSPASRIEEQNVPP
jgi:hypothetical protein